MRKMFPARFRPFCFDNHPAATKGAEILAAPHSLFNRYYVFLFILRNKHTFHRLNFGYVSILTRLFMVVNICFDVSSNFP